MTSFVHVPSGSKVSGEDFERLSQAVGNPESIIASERRSLGSVAARQGYGSVACSDASFPARIFVGPWSPFPVASGAKLLLKAKVARLGDYAVPERFLDAGDGALVSGRYEAVLPADLEGETVYAAESALNQSAFPVETYDAEDVRRMADGYVYDAGGTVSAETLEFGSDPEAYVRREYCDGDEDDWMLYLEDAERDLDCGLATAEWLSRYDLDDIARTPDFVLPRWDCESEEETAKCVAGVWNRHMIAGTDDSEECLDDLAGAMDMVRVDRIYSLVRGRCLRLPRCVATVDLDPEEHRDMWLHAGYGKRDVAPLSELLSETPEAFLGSWVPAEEFLAALRPDEEDGESGERAS